jgi:hypothetical protein
MYSDKLFVLVRPPFRDFVAVLATARLVSTDAWPSLPGCGWIAWMDPQDALRQTNRNMIAFDLVLGSAAILAPAATLRVLGHDAPSPDAEHLFRRCGPIWLTFAAAHAVAQVRDRPEDWWALAWLRGTELGTDILWSRSPAFGRPGARGVMWVAGAANLAMALGFGWLASRG